MTAKRKPDFPNQQAVSMSENESILILKAFILDTKIENPEGYVIANGDHAVLLNELPEYPKLRKELIKERAEVFAQLG